MMQSVKLPTISRSQTRPVWLPESQQLPEFQQNSTFRQDFVRHSLPQMADLRPKISAYVSTLPFSSVSEHRAAYQPDPLVRKRVRVRRGQLTIPTDPFTNVSTYKQEFVTKAGGSTENYKPKDEAQLSDEPFEAHSVYKCDFPKHSCNPSLQESLARLNTKPQYSADDPKVRTLDGTTDYQGNFLDPQVPKRQILPPGYKPPTEPMAGETSYNQVFVPFVNARPAPMFKPTAVAFSSDAPFCGKSLYKDDYVPQPHRRSSANILQNRSSVMTVAKHEEPGMHGVPIETFPENLSGVMFRT